MIKSILNVTEDDRETVVQQILGKALAVQAIDDGKELLYVLRIARFMPLFSTWGFLSGGRGFQPS